MITNVHEVDNLEFLHKANNSTYDLIAIDPPKKTYKKKVKWEKKYADRHNYYFHWMFGRVREMHRILKPHGSLILICDQENAHQTREVLNIIFGEGNCINEIIWVHNPHCSNIGKWSHTYRNILWYAKNPNDYIYKVSLCDTYKTQLVTYKCGKTTYKQRKPADVWYDLKDDEEEPNVYKRIIRVHSKPDSKILDCFSGNGMMGIAANQLAAEDKFKGTLDLVDISTTACQYTLRKLTTMGAQNIHFNGLLFDKHHLIYDHVMRP